MKGVDFKIELPQVVFDIAKAILKEGGRARLVGGFVRDAVFNHIHDTNLDSKDIDIEVEGLPQQALDTLLMRFGKVNREVGQSFAVTKLTVGELEFDFNLPRTEEKTGTGHKGFDIVVDHNLPIEKAVLRRDFTINGLMWDIVEGKLIDLVGGVMDIGQRKLRHISDKFDEDSVRVMRGVQFGGRLGLRMVEQTIEKCKSLKDEFDAIPKERLWTEWEKLLGKSTSFDSGFDILFRTGWFTEFPLNLPSMNSTIGRLQRMVELNLTRKQRVIVGLALLESDMHMDLTNFLTDEKEILREVKELLQMEFDDALLTPCPSRLRIKLAIGMSLKHCEVSTAVAFFLCQNPRVLWSDIQVLDDENLFTRKITGKDLIKAGWNPAKMKEAFGEELDRLFILQLRENLSKEELLDNINSSL